MREVKCYGGPAHGKPMRVDDHCHRLEFMVKILPPRIRCPLTREESHLMWAPPIVGDTCTYYVREFRQQGTTAAKAMVFRGLWAALYEGVDLMQREMYELERDIECLPWKWQAKPNFITHFDQWFEYTLNEIKWETPKVRYL